MDRFVSRCRSAKVNLVVLTTLGVSLVPPEAFSQQIVYQPQNPSFGGSSFNSAHLLAIAEVDRPDPPSNDRDPFATGDEVTQAQLFAEQLERTILGRLSGNITDAIFGENADPEGTFRIDDSTSVEFETALNGDIFVRIRDELSGAVSTIEIPGFLNQTGR